MIDAAAADLLAYQCAEEKAIERWERYEKQATELAWERVTARWIVDEFADLADDVILNAFFGTPHDWHRLRTVMRHAIEKSVAFQSIVEEEINRLAGG